MVVSGGSHFSFLIVNLFHLNVNSGPKRFKSFSIIYFLLSHTFNSKNNGSRNTQVDKIAIFQTSNELIFNILAHGKFSYGVETTMANLIP